MANWEKARERSVSNLQRLYVIVVSLAVTQHLRHLIDLVIQVGFVNFSKYYSDLFIFISFIFIVVPFFHGANRYLDATYVTGERFGKAHGLLVDFVALFGQGMILYIMAIVASNREIFYTMLAILLFLDTLWVMLTRVTVEVESRQQPHYWRWARINGLVGTAILLVAWSDLKFWERWPVELIKNVLLLGLVAARTVYDYVLVWDFYYPVQRGHDQLPAEMPDYENEHGETLASQKEI